MCSQHWRWVCSGPFPLRHTKAGQILTFSNGPVYFPSVLYLQLPRRGEPGFLSYVFSSRRHKAEEGDAAGRNDGAGIVRELREALGKQMWPERPLAGAGAS